MHTLRLLAAMAAAILLLSPGCGSEATPQGSRPRPDLSQPAELPWKNVQLALLRGDVRQVTQTHSLRVTAVLKDGRTVYTRQPRIDEVLRMIQICGERCADTIVATE